MVAGNRFLEVVVFLARNQADLLQGCEVFLGLRRVVDDEVRFADVFVRATMPRVELERTPVVREGKAHLAGMTIRVAKIVLDVGVPRIAKRGRGEPLDRGVPLLRVEGRFPRREIRVEPRLS